MSTGCSLHGTNVPLLARMIAPRVEPAPAGDSVDGPSGPDHR